MNPLYVWVAETPTSTDVVVFRSGHSFDFLQALSNGHPGSVLRTFFPDLDTEITEEIIAGTEGYYLLLCQATDPDLDDKLRPLLMKARLTA